MKVAGGVATLPRPVAPNPEKEGNRGSLPPRHTMIYSVSTSAFPEAAKHLAALYVASQNEAVAKGAKRADRNALAAVVGEGELADLLKSPAPIRVRPSRGQAWEVVGEAGEDEPDRLLVRAIEDEMKRQGLRASELARRSGINHQTLFRFLQDRKGIRWANAVKIVTRGLGKPLGWLDKQFQADA